MKRKPHLIPRSRAPQMASGTPGRHRPSPGSGSSFLGLCFGAGSLFSTAFLWGFSSFLATPLEARTCSIDSRQRALFSPDPALCAAVCSASRLCSEVGASQTSLPQKTRRVNDQATVSLPDDRHHARPSVPRSKADGLIRLETRASHDSCPHGWMSGWVMGV